MTLKCVICKHKQTVNTAMASVPQSIIYQPTYSGNVGMSDALAMSSIKTPQIFYVMKLSQLY